MKATGLCFREFLEFPVLPFDPSIFGFTRDASSSASPAGCPCFTTEDDQFRLWWNWPHPGERAWYGSMSHFFITRRGTSGVHDPLDRNPIELFKTESLSDLVRHLLVTRYADSHFLDGKITEERAIEWFSAIEAAELGFSIDADPGAAIREGQRQFTDTESSVVGAYLTALKSTLGDSVKTAITKSRQFQSS